MLALTKERNQLEEESAVNVRQLINDALEKISHLDDYDRITFKQAMIYINTLQAKKSRLALVVENLISNGVDIPESQRKKMFQRFRSRVSYGKGLCLYKI